MLKLKYTFLIILVLLVVISHHCPNTIPIDTTKGSGLSIKSIFDDIALLLPKYHSDNGTPMIAMLSDRKNPKPIIL